jgi:hypothetical protein
MTQANLDYPLLILHQQPDSLSAKPPLLGKIANPIVMLERWVNIAFRFYCGHVAASRRLALHRRRVK